MKEIIITPYSEIPLGEKWIFEDDANDKLDERPGLTTCMKALRSSDTLQDKLFVDMLVQMVI